MSEYPTMEVPVPTVEELGLDQYMLSGRTASEVVNRRQDLKNKITEMEEEIKTLDSEIGTALDLRNVRNAIYGDLLIIRRQGAKPRATLDRVLLLDAGVTPQQLEAGTKFSEAGRPGITIQSISKTKASGFDEPSRKRGIASSQVFATEKLD